jgi:hypothetical protein
MIQYNREHASNCVHSDWYSPSPRFDDRQFERTFHLKRIMVESIICNLAYYDPFWTSSIDCCGKLSIDPIVKFLAATKLVCYGLLFLAVKG